MSRYSWIFLVSLIALALGIFYLEYIVYRTPVEEPVSDEPTIVFGTSHPDDIPAIIEPEFESVASADIYLNDAGYGIVVSVGRRSRFYPFQIMVWHEAVNDTLNGRDVLVTYDPLTFVSAVYERTDYFGVSGKLWNSNALLYDQTTQSLWSQLKGVAIEGSLQGTTLTRYPSRVVSWQTFKQDYPDGEVLSRQTGFDRDYTQDPYEGYMQSQAVWFPLDVEDTRLSPKSIIFGVEQAGTAMAFPVDSIEEFDTIQTILGGSALLTPAYWFAWSSMYPDTQIFSE